MFLQLSSTPKLTIPKAVSDGTNLNSSFELPDQGDKLRKVFEDYTESEKSINVFNAHLGDPAASRGKFYFLKHSTSSLSEALAELKVESWIKAFDLTGVKEIMSQEDRGKWNDAIENKEVPDFTPVIVQETLNALLHSRGEIFARRVESVFKSLSRKHVTNPAHCFGSKMIIRYADIYSGGYISTNHSQIGYIHDLRYLVSVFMGQPQPSFSTTYSFFNHLLNTEAFGEFYDFDLGAFSVKIHKNGSCHIKIDPDLAWRLNATLASLYGAALPEKLKNTRSSERCAPYIALSETAISADCLSVLADMEYDFILNNDHYPSTRKKIENTAVISIRDSQTLMKETRKELHEILTTCGGVLNLESKREISFKFDYDFLTNVRFQLLSNRSIPDSVSHQFYPTPKFVGQEAIDRAQIEAHHEVLEPEAGNGDIADLIPSDNLTCVEITELRCNILQSKGHKTHQADFLEWSKDHEGEFDRIVTNPPYSKNQALRHVHASFHCLKPGGIMTAILSPTLKEKIKLEGASVIWSDSIPKAFRNTGITVKIVTIIKST